MKYFLLLGLAIVIAIGVSILVVLLINKKHPIKNWLKAIIIPISSSILTVALLLTYLIFNYPASERAKSFLKGDEVIDLNINQYWYHFDNKASDDTALIFYSGAKIDPVAYSPICNSLAHSGVDVYLIKMPLYFPLLNVNASNRVIALNKHNNIYLIGHSLGGTTEAMYLSKSYNPVIKGIIFLASYPTVKLNDSLKCLSIYGSNDLVLNKATYNKNIPLFPSNYKEVIIEGGNHSNFGDYGLQRRDGVATISNEEQANIAKNEIIDFIM